MMMSKINTTLLSLLAVTFLQCGACNAQTVKVPISQNASRPSDENTTRNCDFTAYEPLMISHFYPNKVIKAVKPEYPANSTGRGVQGLIMVKVLVNIAGDVEKACTTEGVEELRQEAERAALQWKFTRNFGFEEKIRLSKKNPDQKKYVQTVLPFQFVLKDGGEDRGIITVTPTQEIDKTNDADDKCDFSSFKPFTVSHFVKTSLKTQFKPTYPSEAVRGGLHGKIGVKILVDRDGNVVKACAFNGDDILRQAAEDAALKWKFKRKVVAGRESFVEAGISFNFVLDETASTDADAIRP